MYNGTDDRTLPQLHQVLLSALDTVSYDMKFMPEVYLQSFKISKPINDMFIESIFSLTLGVVILLPVFVQQIVHEREKELKDQLLIVR
jgi:hypothetical protein